MMEKHDKTGDKPRKPDAAPDLGQKTAEREKLSDDKLEHMGGDKERQKGKPTKDQGSR